MQPPLPPPTRWYEWTPPTPHLSQFPMKQSNKWGSLKIDEIFNLHVESGVSPWVSIPCLQQDTSHIYWFHPPKHLTREKQKNPEMRFNSQQIVLKRLRLCTQNPGIREVDLEPPLSNVVTRSTCWIKAEIPQTETSCIVQSGLTYWSQHLQSYTWNSVLREKPIEQKL